MPLKAVRTAYSYITGAGKVPEVSILDVASYIVQKLNDITPMRLHKLLYYTQAWSTVWEEAPLFKEQIEAWENGPVCPFLFDLHRGVFSIEKSSEIFSNSNADLLSVNQKETVDEVLRFYGKFTGQQLQDIVLYEHPWKFTRKGCEITLASMHE